MTTSGITTWELQSTALVNAAYRKLGYIVLGGTLDAVSLANGVEALNAIVAHLVTLGMPLWKRITYAITLVNGQSVYSLPEDAIKLAQLNIVTSGGGSKWPLIERSLYDFNMLPTNSVGTPVHYWFSPAITNLQPTIAVWPTPDTSAASVYGLSAVYQKKFDGFFSPSDTLDFPNYWTQGIIYKLAYALAPESGLALQDRALLLKEAETALKAASDYGDEDGSFYVQPERRHC